MVTVFNIEKGKEDQYHYSFTSPKEAVAKVYISRHLKEKICLDRIKSVLSEINETEFCYQMGNFVAVKNQKW